MSLQFILGSAKADHRAALIHQIRGILESDEAAQVYYIVPNHVKFDAEVDVLQGLRTASGPYAEQRVSALSFSRLAWFFLKDHQVATNPQLDPATNTMLVAQLLQENKDKLQLFKGSVGHSGFVAQLAAQLSELITGNVLPDTLQDIIDELDPASSGGNKRQKLLELHTLLTAYWQAIGAYDTNASTLATLRALLADPEAGIDLSHTHFVFAHFNELAASELALVGDLMASAASVIVALTLPALPSGNTDEEPDLFLPAARLAQKLLRLAEHDKVALAVPVQAPPRPLTLAMTAVADFWESNNAVNPAAIPAVTSQLTLAKASDPYNELRRVAQRIYQGVREGKHYRDFLVLARHLDPYKNLLEPVFADYDIPFFADIERPMSRHPLVVLIDSVFAIRGLRAVERQRINYNYDDVMRLLRTELFIPTEYADSLADYRLAVDWLDNYLLRTGKRTSAWRDQTAWVYFRDQDFTDADDDTVQKMTTAINTLKTALTDSLRGLFDALANAKTGHDTVSAFYNWLQEVGVPKRLAEWQAADATDDPVASATAEQAWGTFVQLLDAYDTIMGETPADLAQFDRMLMAGFASATYTQIPSSLDAVVVSETAIARLPKYHDVFVIGATATAMPDVAPTTGLLTAADRRLLAERLPAGSFLPITGAEATLSDPFINYLGMLAADQSLTMSYPVAGDGENQVSPYLEQMRTLLLPAPQQLEIWGAVDRTTTVASVLASPSSMRHDWVLMKRRFLASQQPLPALWRGLEQALQEADTSGLFERIAATFSWRNDVGSLSAPIARALYPATLNFSISQLEKFYSNPFEYFLTYGLRLRKRPEFELNIADRGSLYHGVLDAVFSQVLKEGTNLTSLSPEALQVAVNGKLAELEQQLGLEILSANRSMTYTRGRIGRLLTSNLLAIQRQERLSEIRTVQTELNFGMRFDASEKVLPPYRLQTRFGEAQLRGRIDRLDELKLGPQTYFAVVDYKTRDARFDIDSVFSGLSLQLLTYVAAIRQAKGAHYLPFGAFYQHLSLPIFDYAPGLDLVLEQQKAHRLKGLFVTPPGQAETDQLLPLIDESLAEGDQSRVLTLSRLKSGALKSIQDMRVVTPKVLEGLLQQNNDLLTQAIERILTGDIALSPARLRGQSYVMNLSDFKPIMLFDAATGYNHYRDISRAKAAFEDLTNASNAQATKEGDNNE